MRKRRFHARLRVFQLSRNNIMIESLEEIIAQTEELNFFLMIGIAVFVGTVGAKLIQKIHIPQIIGYIIIGVILGPLLRIISTEAIADLEPFNLFNFLSCPKDTLYFLEISHNVSPRRTV